MSCFLIFAIKKKLNFSPRSLNIILKHVDIINQNYLVRKIDTRLFSSFCILNEIPSFDKYIFLLSLDFDFDCYFCYQYNSDLDKTIWKINDRYHIFKNLKVVGKREFFKNEKYLNTFKKKNKDLIGDSNYVMGSSVHNLTQAMGIILKCKEIVEKYKDENKVTVYFHIINKEKIDVYLKD